MIRAFDYEMNEVASIKIDIYNRDLWKERLFVKIYLECLGYRNVDYSKVVRNSFLSSGNMLWPNRLWHSLQESPGEQTDPSVDWDLCELLASTGLLDTDVYPSSYYMSQVNRNFETLVRLKIKNGTGHQVLGITPSLIISFLSVVGTYVSR